MLAGVLLVVGVARGAVLSWAPGGIPSLDVADYLGQAWVYRDLFVAGDLGGALRAALVPNVHPPLHALGLGLGLALFGASVSVACALELVVYVAGLVGVMLLGRTLDRDTGLDAGLWAAAILSFSLEHLRLSTAPMTENAAMLTTVITLGLAVRWDRRGGVTDAVLVGTAALMAALVRWNLGPMLLAPLVTLGYFRNRTTVPWMLAPTGLVLAAWSSVAPDLAPALTTFFTNVDSGLPLLSLENLLWGPGALSSAYLGILGAGLVGLGLGASLLHPRRAQLRVLALTAAIGAVALTVHPFKIARAMHGEVMMLVLLASFGVIAAVERATGRARRAAGGGAVMLGLGAIVTHLSPPVRLELSHDAEAEALLDTIVSTSAAQSAAQSAALPNAAPQVVVSGQIRWLSTYTVALWHRQRGIANVVADTPLRFECWEPTTPPTPNCLPPATAAALESGQPVVLITLTTDDSSRKARLGGRESRDRVINANESGLDWSVPNAALVAAAAEAAGLRPTVLERERPAGTITIWR